MSSSFSYQVASAPPEGKRPEIDSLSATELYHRIDKLMTDHNRLVGLGLWDEYRRIYNQYDHDNDESMRACIGEIEAAMYASKNGTLRARNSRTWKQWSRDLFTSFATIGVAAGAIYVLTGGRPSLPPFSSSPTR